MPKKLSIRPVQREEAELTEFISAASNHPTDKEGNEPWNDPKVREDLMVAVSLRLPEPYVLKLRWLSEKTRISQQELMRGVLLAWIDEQVEKT